MIQLNKQPMTGKSREGEHKKGREDNRKLPNVNLYMTQLDERQRIDD